MQKRSVPPKLELRWCSRPYRSRHAVLGIKSRWTDSTRVYVIVRFSEGMRDYVVYRGQERIAIKKSLTGAKHIALRDARQTVKGFRYVGAVTEAR